MRGIGQGQALVLRQAPDPKARTFDLSRRVLPQGASLTRGSGGSYWDADGVLRVAAADAARFAFGASGAPLGLIVEPTATNLTPFAFDAANAGWTMVGGSKTSGQPDPMGGSGAALFTADGTSGLHYTLSPDTAVTSGATYTLTRLVKPAGGAILAQMSGRSVGFGSGQYANFSLSGAGAVLAATGCTAAIEALPGGWFALSLTLAATATVSNAAIALVFIASGSDARLPTSSSTGSLVSTGAQIVQAGAASSAIVTGASAATRAADVLTLDWASRGVADGAITVRYTFDDGSSQDVATTVAGGTAAVPTNLARRAILGIRAL